MADLPITGQKGQLSGFAAALLMGPFCRVCQIIEKSCQSTWNSSVWTIQIHVRVRGVHQCGPYKSTPSSSQQLICFDNEGVLVVLGLKRSIREACRGFPL